MTESRHRHASWRRGAASAGALVLTAGLTGCSSGSAEPGAAAPAARGGAASGPAGRIVANIEPGARAVPVDRVLEVRAEDATIAQVAVSSPAGPVAGRLSEDGSRWRATGRLEPGTAYVVRARGKSADGERVTSTSRFRTVPLTLDQQTYPSVAPLQGETVGIGMPVIVTFDVAVTDRASIEEHLSVRSVPRQEGSWHWLSGHEVHWRPKEYWQAGTEVTVDVDVNSVPAGGGIYGQESRTVEFEVGAANVYRVDAAAHQMKVFRGGDLLRTLPVTTGKPGFTTRSGTKVIMEKFASRRMNSETVGIPAGSAEAYDIDDVQWAMRLTYSGEFIHAAPWSVGSQGSANVSHGCTGLSTEDAAWLYSISKRGDVVEYTGTDRPMTLENGYGDWNASFAEYRRGSALG